MIQHYRYSNRSYMLPVSDPDGDMVRCRYAANSTEGGGVYHSRIPYSTLHTNCTLSISSYNSNGWYALAIMVEDFAYSFGSGQYERQSSIPLQFMVYIYSTRETTMYGNDTTTDCSVNNTSAVATTSVQPSTSVTFQTSATPAYSAWQSAMPQTTSRIQALDGCKYYQVLSNNDRAATFSDWSSYRCDKELFGWYRFMGNAGNRMMNSCPKNLGGSVYRCGSYYQGWIQNGALPSVSDGVVARYVCFSPHYSCSCSSTKSIMIRNCGTFHVYWLDSVPMCNSRYCGIKDKSSVVSCTQNYMRIDFDRAFYDTSLFSSITLRDTSCSASISSYNIILGSVPGACGSTRSETSSYIVYENEVIFKPKAISGIIIRDPDQRVKFTCYFEKNAYVSSYRYLPISNVTGSEVGYGNFSFNFVMYTDHTYSTMHSHYPVSVQLRDWMHFEVYSSNSDNNTVILIDQCFSTPTMDRNHYMKYVFINNRCPNDNTVQFHKTQNHRQRFSIQSFKFLNNSTSVYFHCLVFLCHSTSTDYRCRYGCTGNNIFRGKRDLSGVSNDPPSKFYMVEREVRRAAGSSQDKAQKGHEDKTTAFVGMGVAVAVLVAVVAGLAFKVAHMKKSAKVAPRPEKDNRYAGSQEDLPPEQHKDDGHLYDDAEMQNIGVISKEQQAEFFKDNAFCS
ncbi:pancreatic secretory granule membrane major glycoprotein GP2-like isoform X1 [Rhopilema esculentum]|uniref:pancreatic secretory granule membrane major glycoprotein GP2-like isoform X1 n=1 Tax=Rhopilema esculentum TaxID=499914 RepID=UPI0031D207DA